MPTVYDAALVIAEVICAHCPGTSARQRFLQACISTDWDEVGSMIDGMLAEPWFLRGFQDQERQLREFLELISAERATKAALLPRLNLLSAGRAWIFCAIFSAMPTSA